ncbi:MAG: CHAT domain-containing protein [Myxococcota bacterium]
MEALRTALVEGSPHEAPALTLFRRVFEPLHSELAAIRELVVATDGTGGLAPLELVAETGGLDARVRRVTSGRDLLTPATPGALVTLEASTPAEIASREVGAVAVIAPPERATLRGTAHLEAALRRALAVAGARCQLLPRWPIPPPATRLFLDALGSAFATGIPIGVAVDEARTRLRESPDFGHAGVWASFGLSGDPTVQLA